jgi:hypothetical protein
MRGHPRISPIYRLGPGSRPDPERVFARIWRWCRDLWIEQGTIVAKPSELPDHLRGPLVEWANQTYGESRHGKG